MHPADVQDREVSRVLADGGTRGSTRRDRLKELMLPDLLEIVERTFARSPERSLARVQRAACRFLMRRIARGTRA
ncbi:MAG: hypothetical protein OXC93_09880 [Rhodospirillaceae bacterium]|nr:hypothetical protein [Rhodospirillaceae bacterium]